jgi:hypothetical protein
MAESPDALAVAAPRRYVARMRRRCAWYRRGGAVLCLAAVPLFAAAADSDHFAALVMLLLGLSCVAGGFSWGLALRGAPEVLASQPRQMLMDRWLNPGVRYGAWKTRLRTLAGESEMLGSGQLSREIKRVQGASCLVYGPLRPGGLVIVALGEDTLIGSGELPRRGSRKTPPERAFP